MKKRLKILQLQPDYNVKLIDASDLAEQIVKSLPNDSFEVTSAYFSGKPSINQPQSVAENCYYFNLPDTALKGLRIRALWKLYHYCRQHKFDVVICNRFKMVSLLLQINLLLKVPLCIGISHVVNEYHRRYRRFQIKIFADKHWQFVGVSDAVKDCLISYDCGFNQKNTHAIPNAIDIEKCESFQLSKDLAREKLGLPKNKIIIGAIGQLFPRKGHRFLLSALTNIKDRFPDVDICIIGKGKEESNLQLQAIKSGLENRVHLVGFQANALQYVKAFDVFTMSSLKEGLPLALLEGMSGRIPLIASNIPEMRDIVVSAGGLVFTPGDIDQLTKALESYLSLDKITLEKKGQEAFDYLFKNHSIHNYRYAYRTLIENNS
jgi:glycosyltransferase involved in cell wall biosynthesis